MLIRLISSHVESILTKANAIKTNAVIMLIKYLCFLSKAAHNGNINISPKAKYILSLPPKGVVNAITERDSINNSNIKTSL